MSSSKRIIWHNYKTGRATLEDFEEYLHSLPDTDWKTYNLQRVAKEKHPQPGSDEPTRLEPPTLEASRPDGTNGNPNPNQYHNPWGQEGHEGDKNAARRQIGQ